MKKVLHISKYYYPFSGGIEQIARDYVLALRNQYEQKVIAFNENEKDIEEYVDGIEVIKCGVQAKISAQALSLSYGKKLKEVIANFKPDIVVFHYPNPFVAHFLIKELKNNSKIKLVVYWHLDIIRQKFLKVFFTGQNRNLLKRADKVIATSPNYIEGSAWLNSARNKCVVVPNCVNIDRMTINDEVLTLSEKIKKEYKNNIICVAVGRHTAYKGFDYLIKACKNLDSRFKVFITGTGELTESLKNEASNDDKIVFTGRVSDLELKALILSADIFCFSSITKNEAFGVALAEAMYYEKPAVTFTIPGSGVNYVSINGVTGIEVENRNASLYADAMKMLADNPELRRQYGLAAKKRVEENFLSSQFAININKLIQDI